MANEPTFFSLEMHPSEVEKRARIALSLSRSSPPHKSSTKHSLKDTLRKQWRPFYERLNPDDLRVVWIGLSDKELRAVNTQHALSLKPGYQLVPVWLAQEFKLDPVTSLRVHDMTKNEVGLIVDYMVSGKL